MKERKITKKVSFADTPIYIGMDVHKKSWTVTILTEHSFHKKMQIAPKASELYNYLSYHFPDGDYHSVYESGFCGYSVHQNLAALGIKNIIVHAADVPVGHKEKSFKKDGRDSRQLALALRGNLLTGIHIPDQSAIELKQLLHSRDRVRKNLARVKNQIKAQLAYYGREIDLEGHQSWSKVHITKLKEIIMHTEEGDFSFQSLLQDLDYFRRQKLAFHRYLRQLSKNETYKEDCELLVSIPGIGIITAMILIAELGTITRFPNLDTICAYAGICPTTHSSGEKNRVGKLTVRGNKYVKNAIIEASWTFKRLDPAMAKCFDDLCKRNLGSNKAIIRIAKKLLSRIRFVLTNRVKYELNRTR